MFTTAEVTAILNREFRDTNYPVYIGFSTTAPTEKDEKGVITLTGFTEPEIGYATGYFRGTLHTEEQPLLEAPAKRQIQNKDVCYMSLLRQTIPDQMTHFGLFRQKTGGTPFFYGELVNPVPFEADHIPVVDIGGFVVGLDKAQLDEAKTWEDYV